ncbi:hypothetical protein Lfu02_31380 [Longispora fulva]|uniref:DNA helicase DnaB-like N-terminal domain-containing protein n=1 Tax=Longispora fulva TaxID=619741 RepID=A0A8J7KS65_9ACTN|nr:DUF3987 domain-containing protein [Longispora fulva]MBG6139272.1 hypothetical protein [Longispora fulva]GIG58766.1 hypothetical protein Lfu02_31380 [Longispora fulva]
MERSLPHDLDAERLVVGAAMLDPSVILTTKGVVGAGDFYYPRHMIIWQTLHSLHASGAPTDPVAVAAHLADNGELNRVGGVAYLHDCVRAVPTSANAGYYARIVADHARNRDVVTIGTRLINAGSNGTDTAQLLAEGRTWLEQAAQTVGVWPAPIPLGSRATLPTFPIEVLPEWVGDMVAGVTEFTQTPPDVAGTLALAALSTAAGGRAEVEVRGSWREPVNLFAVVVLPPGARKSAVFAAMIGPLLVAERAMTERVKPLIIEAELASRVATKAAEKATVVAANADATTRDALLADAIAAAMQADSVTVPVIPQLIADDVTSEKAASLLCEQGGRIAVLSAEGGIFATLAGRYSGTPNLEVFLKGHAGDMLRVGRQGRQSEHVERPALTLGLAVQPDVLRDIASLPGFRGKGLLARILFAVPENTVGRRRIGTEPVTAEVTDTYATNLTRLVCAMADWTDPAALPLTPEANERVLDIERDTEPRLAPGAEWSHIVDWGSKYTGAIVRIAGLLHLAQHLDDGPCRPVTADTLERATILGHYYATHALAAFDDMGADPTVAQARTALVWITRTRTDRLTKRDLYRGTQNHFKTAAHLDPVLELLENHGYIRQLPTSQKVGGGRPPSPTYEVHPELDKHTNPNLTR